MKISYVMNVLNGEPFIKYQLDSIYKFAHEIIIIEGAYLKFSHATINGRSKDNTIKTIENYNDEENKIKLITNDGFYNDRKEMCNEFLKYVTGEIIWQIDADEFYFPETHKYVHDIFQSDPELDLLSFNFKDYYINTSYYIMGYESIGLTNVNRVHRYEKNNIWVNQRPPTLGYENGELKKIRKKIEGPQLEKDRHVMHHATMIFDEQITDKFKYYNSMWSNVNKPTKWYKDTWLDFENKFNVAGFRANITFLLENKDDVPFHLKLLFEDVNKGLVPGYRLRDDTKVRVFINSTRYKEYKDIATSVDNVTSSPLIKSLMAYLLICLRSFKITERKSFLYLHYVLVRKVMSKLKSSIQRSGK